MTRFYKILRSIIVFLAVLLLVLPAFAYVILSLPEIDQRICNVAKKELSELLGANVNISSAEIKPFSQVALNNISVTIADCDTVLDRKSTRRNSRPAGEWGVGGGGW